MPDQNPKAFQNLPEDEKTSYILRPGEVSPPAGIDSFARTYGQEGSFNKTVSIAHTTLAGGKYQINEELGRGGMSVVYAATDLSLGRKVAVKVLLDEYAQSAGPQAAARFQQEARAVAKLSHPHIISIYEYGLLPEGAPFIVMDYVEGVSLESEMQTHGLMVEERVLEIIKQSARALRHSHSQGVVHRDIKPSNILLTKGDDGEDFVRLVDFGIAKMQTPDQEGKLTATGQVFGSPLYMSPEQCEGAPVDARSDIYSLGCVAYEMITGRPPFVGKNVVETMHRKMTSQPQPFFYAGDEHVKGKKKGSGHDSDVAFKQALQSVVLKMLAPDPTVRQQNAEELLSELQGVTKAASSLEEDKRHKKVFAPNNLGAAAPGQTFKISDKASGAKKGPSILTLLLLGAALVALPGIIIYCSNFLDTSKEKADVALDEKPSSSTKTNLTSTSSNSFDATIGDTAADFDKFVDSSHPVASGAAGYVSKAGDEHEKEGGINLDQWIATESAGQVAFQGGDLEQAQREFNDGLSKAQILVGSKRKYALDISLSDSVDLAFAQTGKAKDASVWQQYSDMITQKKQDTARADDYLARALSSFSADGQVVSADKADALTIVLRQTLARVKEEIDDERFGDAERLLLMALQLTRQRQNDDGILAASYHYLAQIRASQKTPDWKRALDYSNKACEASQGNTKTLQANMAEALLYKALALSQMDKSPEDSYKQAIDIDQSVGDRGNVNQISAIKGLAIYYQKLGDTEQARETASHGLQIAATAKFAKRAEAVKLECMATFNSILGKQDVAISDQAEAVKRLDCTLPRQDYRVMQGLRALARYYVENKQPDMAQFARNRADAIGQRLAKLDKIYQPTAL